MKEKETIIKDVLDFNKWMYSLTGFGNADFPGKFQRMFYIAYRTIIQISFCVHLGIMYNEIVVFANNLPMLSFTLSFVLLSTVGIFKIIIMNLRREEVEGMKKRLDENLNLPWVGQEDWEKELKRKNSNLLKITVTLIYLSVFAACLLTASLPLVKNGKQKFFIPFSFNFIAKTRFYVPLYVFQIFSMFVFLTNFISNDMIFIGLITRLCENLEIVETNLKRYTASYYRFPTFNLDDKRKSAFVKDVEVVKQTEIWKGNKILIKRCIIHHQAVLRELKIIIDVYSIPVVLHFIFGPFLCGFLSFVIFSDLDQDDIIIQQIAFASIAALYLLLFCYCGSYVIQKFQDVRFAFYSYPWYETDVETRKLILIVLLGLGKCGKLTVGKIFDVTLTEFLTIAKTAYNVVTVLRNTS